MEDRVNRTETADTEVSDELFGGLARELEQINEEAEAYLDSLEIALEQKTEGVLLAIKGMKAEAEAIRNEEKALADRRHGLEKKADSLTEFIKERLAGEKFKTPRVSVSYRKTTSCEITDEWAIPEDYVKTTVSYDKVALTKALKSGEVPGARLVEGQSMIIK